MERQEILYLLLGLALGVIFSSVLFLRAPAASERAYELGIRKKGESTQYTNPTLNQKGEKSQDIQTFPSY